MNPVEAYLKNLHSDYASGAVTGETSGYGHLQVLLNELGKSLKPKVRCQIQLKNKGAGQPDGGFFTADQFRKLADEAPLDGQPPARGAIEIKGPEENLDDTIENQQVKEVYLPKYRLVLATNYWDFRLLTQSKTGESQVLESFRLANSAEEFWRTAAHPQKAASDRGEEFTEYLKRVMLHNAPLSEPKDVAWFLASYARDARARMAKAEVEALANIRTALEEALGLKFEGEKGEHFFRSTLVQTLFYGIFSAWVLWSKQKKSAPNRNGSQESFKATGHLAEPPTTYKASNTPQSASVFDWRLTQYYLRVPILRKLFHEVADPGQLEAVKLSEVLEWSANALNRVQSAEFFSKFEEEHAVQYFYEPFLEAFDPELRKDLGVWYTPREIVQYMVARVDTVLRTELDIADGLADPRVYVLDPCCGTGAYLVEVLKRIHQTLKEKGNNALVADELKNAAMHRVFGFEILPAPFVVSHLQIGLLLQNLDAPLAEQASERVGVYLTNSLTGWEPPKEPKTQVALWPELEAERRNADDIKQSTPILVILGNPPYNAFAGTSPVEEEGLVETYKEGLVKEWGIKKFNLDDLYVRFFRLAERRIAEKTGQGVVSFISNHSWLSDPSFVVLRKHLLQSFDKFWIENMHGDRRISEYAPDGRTSETIFAIAGFSPGIQQGVAISTWVRSRKKKTGASVFFRDDLNEARAEERRTHLVESLKVKKFQQQYTSSTPDETNRFSFRIMNVDSAYLSWPKLTEISSIQPSNGLMEKRSGALIDIDRTELETRMRMYFDPHITWESLKNLKTGLTDDAAGFDARETRLKAIKSASYDNKMVCRYAVRPLESRWCYYSQVATLWNRNRPSLWQQCWDGNAFLASRMNAAKDPEGPPIYFVRGLSDDHMLAPDAACFAVKLNNSAEEAEKIQREIFRSEKKSNASVANLSQRAREYLSELKISYVDDDFEEAAFVWMHALAIGYSPLYLTENRDGIRQDWPRIPLPKSESTLRYSASLGTQIAKLLDTETEVKGITSGTIAPEMKNIAEPSHAEGKQLRTDRGVLEVTAGWGHGGKDGVTMPGKGKIVRRDYSKEELKALEKGAKAHGITVKEAQKHLGESTCDIYLNDVAYWKNVPEKVWDYTIGGYQVIKKWLSYREKDLLGRSLTGEEVKEVMNMARRISAILWLESKLNENYRNVKKASWKW